MSKPESDTDGFASWVEKTFCALPQVRTGIEYELFLCGQRCGLTDQEAVVFVGLTYENVIKVFPQMMANAVLESCMIGISETTATAKRVSLSREQLRTIRKYGTDLIAQLADARGRKPTHEIDPDELRRHYDTVYYPLWKKAKRSPKIRASLPPFLVAHLMHNDDHALGQEAEIPARDWDKLAEAPFTPKACALLHAAILCGELPLALSYKQLSRILPPAKITTRQ